MTSRSALAAPRRLRFGLVAAIALVILGGCSSSAKLVNMWRDPQAPQTPLKSSLVVVMKKDAALRRLWEDGLASELVAHGVQATPSYRLFETDVPDTQQVIDAVRAQGFDGVLVTHKLDTELETNYVPGYVTTQPVTVSNPWTGAYRTYYERVHVPGYTETDQVVRYQTDLWTTQPEGRMIWTGTTESINPTSSDAVNRDLVHTIVPELAKQGFIPPSAKK